MEKKQEVLDPVFTPIADVTQPVEDPGSITMVPTVETEIVETEAESVTVTEVEIAAVSDTADDTTSTKKPIKKGSRFKVTAMAPNGLTFDGAKVRVMLSPTPVQISMVTYDPATKELVFSAPAFEVKANPKELTKGASSEIFRLHATKDGEQNGPPFPTDGPYFLYICHKKGEQGDLLTELNFQIANPSVLDLTP